MEKHFTHEQLNTPITDFRRRQCYKIATGKKKEWIEYQIFAHIGAGKC